MVLKAQMVSFGCFVLFISKAEKKKLTLSRDAEFSSGENRALGFPGPSPASNTCPSTLERFFQFDGLMD